MIKKFAILTMFVATMMTLTSCQKEITDYLIGQWNKTTVTTTVDGKSNTKKLNGNYEFKEDGTLYHSYKPQNSGTWKTEEGTWTLANANIGSLWLTFGDKTQVMHIDQIDDHTMQWSNYERNQANEMITYVYKFSR